MDTKNPNKKYRTTPEYAEYQRENFWASNEGKVPPFNTGEPLLRALCYPSTADAVDQTRPSLRN